MCTKNVPKSACFWCSLPFDRQDTTRTPFWVCSSCLVSFNTYTSAASVAHIGSKKHGRAYKVRLRFFYFDFDTRGIPLVFTFLTQREGLSLHVASVSPFPMQRGGLALPVVLVSPFSHAMRRVTPPCCVSFPIFDATGRAISFSLFSIQRGGSPLCWFPLFLTQ